MASTGLVCSKCGREAMNLRGDEGFLKCMECYYGVSYRSPEPPTTETPIYRHSVADDYDFGGTEPAAPESILEEAKKLVDGARGDKYGHPADDFAALGRFWGAILTRYYEGQGRTLHIDDIPPATVALMLGAIKLNREAARHMRDNLVDGVGYWYTVELIKERDGK